MNFYKAKPTSTFPNGPLTATEQNRFHARVQIRKTCCLFSRDAIASLLAVQIDDVFDGRLRVTRSVRALRWSAEST